MTDIQTLATSIQGIIVSPPSEDYEKAIHRPSLTSVLRSSHVVFPATPTDIPPTIEFARSQNLEIAVKGGGCHTSNVSSSEGGIVIDLSKLNKVTLSQDKKSVAVQGGAVWGDVYSALEKDNLAVVGGNVWFVGVGGYITGGGYSSTSGKYGLAIDNLLKATAVLADGRIVECSETVEPDLFWAIRGSYVLDSTEAKFESFLGGTNQFGIVTEFVLKTYPHQPALVGALAYPGTELANVLKVVRVSLCVFYLEQGSPFQNRTSSTHSLQTPISSSCLRVDLLIFM